jgi:sec-independent protein translocase protein TatB
MNIFSNIGITELVAILLLALLVVGPERLPEMGRKLAKTLRDIRRAYDNLSREIGPELTSIQQTTQELRKSVDSVRSIPQEMVQTVVEAADLDDTIDELKDMADSVGQVGQTLATAGQAIKNPLDAAVGSARDALLPTDPVEPQTAAEDEPAGDPIQGQTDAAPAETTSEADSLPESKTDRTATEGDGEAIEPAEGQDRE